MKSLSDYLLFILIICSTIGCTKIVVDEEQSNAAQNCPDSFIEVDYNSEIVSMLTSLPLNCEVCSEVANVVKQSVNYGLDEDFIFRELWVPETRVSSTHGSMLKRQIDNYFNSKISTKSSISSVESVLKNTDVSIYWPYCDDWDGKTLPTITCPPKDESQEWNYGYKLNEKDGAIELEIVIVDEEYAINYPVWVIKDTDYNYSDLPYFINGEYSTNGNTYYPNKVETRSGSNTMYGWAMTSMTVSKQYDKMFWNGGSEFKIAASFPTATGYAGSTNTFNISFTRKEIRNKTKKYLDYGMNSDNVLNYNWTENQYSNGLAIWEVNGKKATTDYTLGCTAQIGTDSAKVTCSATVKISPKDELIVNREYTRGYMFSSYGTLPQSYDEGNVVFSYHIVNY